MEIITNQYIARLASELELLPIQINPISIITMQIYIIAHYEAVGTH